MVKQNMFSTFSEKVAKGQAQEALGKAARSVTIPPTFPEEGVSGTPVLY